VYSTRCRLCIKDYILSVFSHEPFSACRYGLEGNDQSLVGALGKLWTRVLKSPDAALGIDYLLGPAAHTCSRRGETSSPNPHATQQCYKHAGGLKFKFQVGAAQAGATTGAGAAGRKGAKFSTPTSPDGLAEEDLDGLAVPELKQACRDAKLLVGGARSLCCVID
jgi:hypothetical protein